MGETAQLTSKFRRIRMELAREKGHPVRNPHEGYDLLVPLDECGRLDEDEYKHHQDLCRVRRFRPKGSDLLGRVRRKPGGQWYFEYANGDCDDELALHWSGEHFLWGEYISVQSGGTIHTYRITHIERPVE
ncbi:hypothetical protein CU102_02750 [Phyllobacterium brassicacearum]|uniref:Uncharacterized protein n=1 Tax=Phyllobacterium brassicacearum TaxID=314235 RepID=A0A2P7BU95_9HYPH|nr:hypothetical protein [Phyllobacterium brassicacearum]PSH70044.1 hypothetical protein CU102_02750 [Phyllobacterium brassicacearum]TDQ34099.1 hypothetical protein DEV91_104302 [Phyllobacterium brassicacearum]